MYLVTYRTSAFGGGLGMACGLLALSSWSFVGLRRVVELGREERSQDIVPQA